MPSYPFSFTTPAGPQSARFSLEDEDPLAPQVAQVVEELRAIGHVLRGGPEDELAVFWGGKEIDASQSIRALGVVPAFPIELRMRPRPVRSHQVVAEAYLPRGAYAAALLGASAALVPWGLGLLITDLNDVVFSYEALDLLLAAVGGLCIGSVTLWYEAFRRIRPSGGQAFLGALVGLVAATVAMLTALAVESTTPPNAQFARLFGNRMLAWALVSALLAGGLVAVRHRSIRRMAVALAIGLVAGAVAAAVHNFPGPTVLWQGIGLMLLGGTSGFLVSGLQLAGARALLEVEAVNRRAVGLVGARGMVLLPNQAANLVAIGRREARGPSATVEYDGRVIKVHGPGSSGPDSGIRVGGEALEGSVLVGDGETIDVATTRYRIHLVSGGAA